MRHASSLRRLISRDVDHRSATRGKSFRARLEKLEDRNLLAGDLLISTYDTTDGEAVLRFHDVTWNRTDGTDATGSFAVPQGLAVAADGTYYVSNATAFPGEVWHFDVDGTFLDVLGAGDAVPVTLFVPGNLQFSPVNGHLYVADIAASTIYEFDTSAVGQQAVGGQFLGVDYLPAGFTFAPDGSNELIVGGLQNHTVTRYHNNMTTTLIIDPNDSDNINPSSILARPNGDLLIADFDLGAEPMDHHRVVHWDEDTGDVTTLINFTEPLGTGASEDFPAQPTVMIYDENGDLLVGLSPDHNLNGAVGRYNPDTGAQIGDFLITGIGTPTGMGFTASLTSDVAGRHIFYNNSKFDSAGNDDAAIATGKTALLPGTQATIQNVTSYSRGINGIMIDLTVSEANHAAISDSDFVFKVGSNNSPSTWATLTATPTITVRTGAGVSGSDRVQITWTDNAIQDQYLEVQVLATANTGLVSAGYASPDDDIGDVFYFGNLIGETSATTPAGAFARTVAADGGAILANGTQANVGITNHLDVDRSNSVTIAGDRGPIIMLGTGSLTRIQIGSAGPFAPDGGDGVAPAAGPTGSGGDAGLSSGLTSPSAGRLEPQASLPANVAARLDRAKAGAAAIAAGVQLLDNAGAALDEGDDDAGIDDELLEALLDLS
jgi:hypothetical protein